MPRAADFGELGRDCRCSKAAGVYSGVTTLSVFKDRTSGWLPVANLRGNVIFGLKNVANFGIFF